ncbi:hypothetical protein JTB14_018430 [Gonioctena quinquepunctata]|nr:hypothetical protein JTB14_018430 [Gonioctena quinquepunctata]
MDQIERVLQEAMNNLTRETLHLGFKTKYVHFCRFRSRHRDAQLRMYGGELDCKESMKDFAMYCDDKLTWDTHMKICYGCGILAQPQHPYYPPTLSDGEYDIYVRRARPAGICLRELLNSLDTQRIHNWTTYETPPWTLNIPKMELQLTEMEKKRNEPKPYHKRIPQDEKLVPRK